MTDRVLIVMKAGATFALNCTYAVDGTPVDLTGYTIQSQVRDATGAVQAGVTVAIAADQTANKGQFTVNAAPADTAGWTVGISTNDIKYTDAGGYTESSDTINIRVDPPVTHA